MIDAEWVAWLRISENTSELERAKTKYLTSSRPTVTPGVPTHPIVRPDKNLSILDQSPVIMARLFGALRHGTSVDRHRHLGLSSTSSCTLNCSRVRLFHTSWMNSTSSVARIAFQTKDLRMART
ncbi:hypothetical protein PAXRUDRAFT_570107 [Paxillus rubicundulus Ve08.2h10]|uniref:Uncharacterized protein n=1 Tax=Paxillus rubicundulus Ve08.2h10 TaxID=930991 RepID=A0A0D0E962_9AGAM|nr:hypothetical protein PAXRUDRAFT_570107 [Paxillus rubicundulus Ve08.2h10]